MSDQEGGNRRAAIVRKVFKVMRNGEEVGPTCGSMRVTKMKYGARWKIDVIGGLGSVADKFLEVPRGAEIGFRLPAKKEC